MHCRGLKQGVLAKAGFQNGGHVPTPSVNIYTLFAVQSPDMVLPQEVRKQDNDL